MPETFDDYANGEHGTYPEYSSLASIAAEIAECGADLLQYTERLFPQAGAIGVQYLPAAYPGNRRYQLT